VAFKHFGYSMSSPVAILNHEQSEYAREIGEKIKFAPDAI